MNWLEIVGYVGSVLVAVSLAMSDILKLRLINLVGSAIFTVYGVLVHAYPVAMVNGCIVVMNIWHLMHMARDRDFFEVLPVPSAQGAYLHRFLQYHRDEITLLAPDFDLAKLDHPQVLFILRNLEPAGLVVWTDRGDGTVRVDLDFAAPEFRNLRCGRWFFTDREAWFAARGYNSFEAHTPLPRPARYLRAVGFTADSERRDGWFRRSIAVSATEGCST